MTGVETLLLAVGGVAVALIAVAVGEVWRTRTAARRDARRIGDGQAIFILGYWLVDGGRPSAPYQARLDLGRALWEQHRMPIWCLAGRLASMERTNAYYSHRYLLGRGVPAHAVRTLDEFPALGQPVETIQEVRAAYELSRRVDVRRLVVISDVLHLAQVRLVMRAFDLEPIFVASPFPRPWSLGQLGYAVVRLGLIVLTLLDRQGQTLGWLRMWRRGEFPGVGGAVRP